MLHSRLQPELCLIKARYQRNGSSEKQVDPHFGCVAVCWRMANIGVAPALAPTRILLGPLSNSGWIPILVPSMFSRLHRGTSARHRGLLRTGDGERRWRLVSCLVWPGRSLGQPFVEAYGTSVSPAHGGHGAEFSNVTAALETERRLRGYAIEGDQVQGEEGRAAHLAGTYPRNKKR
jgi:hypothetical protein